MLQKDEWKYDIVPEIMDGKNIADFVDADILEKLAMLEQEEDEMFANAGFEFEEEADPQLVQAGNEVKSKMALLRLGHKLNKKAGKISANQRNRTVKVREKLQKRSEIKNGKKNMDESAMEVEGNERERTRSKSKAREMTRSRSKGVKSFTPVSSAIMRMTKKIQKQWRGIGQETEADRRFPNMMPKHLFSGKRTIGKTDRR